MIEWFLENIPNIFAIFAGLAISWGMFTTYGLSKIMLRVKKENQNQRRFDILSFCGVTTVVLGNIIFLFFAPITALLIVDVLLIIDIWFILFLIYLTISELSVLPYLNSIRLLRTPRTIGRSTRPKNFV